MSLEKPCWRETIGCLRRDTQRYSDRGTGGWKQAIKNLYSHPAYAGVVFYRLGRWAWAGGRNPIRWGLYFLYRIFYPFVRWHSGVELQARTHIGPGMCIMHFGPVVLHPNMIAGEDFTILPGVTIGEGKNNGTPRFGNGVAVGSGAIIIGPIQIGDDVNIGAGAVVTHDLPSHCTAVGVPARPVLSTHSTGM